jgi:hypothetical protein
MPIPDEAERRRRAEQVRAMVELRERRAAAKDRPKNPDVAAEPDAEKKEPAPGAATAPEEPNL